MLEVTLEYEDGHIDRPCKENNFHAPLNTYMGLVLENKDDGDVVYQIAMPSENELTPDKFLYPGEKHTFPIYYDGSVNDFSVFESYILQSEHNVIDDYHTTTKLTTRMHNRNFRIDGLRVRHNKHCGRFVDETPEWKTPGCKVCDPSLEKDISYPITTLTGKPEGIDS
jgi:hypothetical protein